ncbi:hypothetical protein VTO73DRAFT_10125 [Trametes versicolor]
MLRCCKRRNVSLGEPPGGRNWGTLELWKASVDCPALGTDWNGSTPYTLWEAVVLPRALWTRARRYVSARRKAKANLGKAKAQGKGALSRYWPRAKRALMVFERGEEGGVKCRVGWAREARSKAYLHAEAVCHWRYAFRQSASVYEVADAFAVLWFLGHRVFSSRPRDGGRRGRKDAEASAAPSAPSPVQAASCLSWGGRASEQEQARHAYVYVCPSKPARGASRSLQSPSPPAPPLPITAPAAAYGYGHGRGYGYHDVPRDAQSAKKGTGG